MNDCYLEDILGQHPDLKKHAHESSSSVVPAVIWHMTGDVSLDSGDVSLDSGDVSLDSGDVSLDSGDISGDRIIGSDLIWSSEGFRGMFCIN